MNLLSDSMQSMKELLRKSRKVKRVATLEDAEIDGACLTAHARIVRRFRDEKDLGVRRYPYELSPGVSPFSGGYFEHREWAILRQAGAWRGLLAYVHFSNMRLTIRTPHGTG
jgi:hypothetical protein